MSMSDSQESPGLKHFLFFLDKKVLIEPDRVLRIGRDAGCDIVLEERTVSRMHAEIRREGDQIILKDQGSTNGTHVNYHPVTEQVLNNEDRVTIGPFVLVYRIIEGDGETPVRSEENILSETLVLESKIASILQSISDPKIRNQLFELKHIINQSKEKLSRMAHIDRLTLLYNRRYFDDALAREVERARRYSQPLCLLMIDIDHFKQFNDTYGHQKGDLVLAEVARIISDSIRMNDLAARYGGEEMTVILPETSLENALVAAEKLRAGIETESLARTGVLVTASLGIAAYMAGDNAAAEMIARADAAMYEAKKNGRNRIEAQKETPELKKPSN